MTDLIYTPEFYNALEKLVDHRPHKCKQCGISDGTRKLNKDGSKQNFERIVRLCVDDAHKPSNDPNNIAFFCTRCRHAPFEWRTPRSIKPSKLPQLFQMTLLERIQAEARNKVPPKPPQVDDDGEIIPF